MTYFMAWIAFTLLWTAFKLVLLEIEERRR